MSRFMIFSCAEAKEGEVEEKKREGGNEKGKRVWHVEFHTPTQQHAHTGNLLNLWNLLTANLLSLMASPTELWSAY